MAINGTPSDDDLDGAESQIELAGNVTLTAADFLLDFVL